MLEEASSVERCIGICLDKGIEFAICLPPGDKKARIFIPAAGNDHAGGTVFEIGPWLAPYSGRISVGGETDVASALRFLEHAPADAQNASPSFSLPRTSTRKETYIEEISKVIESCRRRGGKTVFSRVICGEAATQSWPAIFTSLCGTFPDTFRFIFHTKATGGWTGATPETLLDVNLGDNTFGTMAFAGTRRQSPDPAPWDAKNIRENRYVSDFIVSRIESLGMEAQTGPLETVTYGSNIEHLCRRISGRLPHGAGFRQLLDAINPTPALCGTPIDDAVNDLNRHESHNRGCYGGFVALHGKNRFRAFVTLRCAAFTSGHFAIYAGGGITPDSEPMKEWDETEAKSLFFRQCLQKNM